MAAPGKEVLVVVKLALPAGQATPAPPVGTALGPHGINIGMFVKQYNDATRPQQGTVVPVELTIFKDKSFSFVLKTPPASVLLKKAANVAKGSGITGKETVGTVNRKQVEEIAKVKLPDLRANSIEAAMRVVEGTARSMGIKVEG
ncbi:MAG: 50S ribosomal protein L11 [Planctomycetes bacterium]|nr:50S ribosomal protein L11 [Planctomycetota bacterium]